MNKQQNKQKLWTTHIYTYIMWHKPCRTFHPWCPCIKTRCLLSYLCICNWCLVMLSLGHSACVCMWCSYFEINILFASKQKTQTQTHTCDTSCETLNQELNCPISHNHSMIFGWLDAHPVTMVTVHRMVNVGVLVKPAAVIQIKTPCH